MLQPKAHRNLTGGRHELILGGGTITVKIGYTDQTSAYDLACAAYDVWKAIAELAETLRQPQPTEITLEAEG